MANVNETTTKFKVDISELKSAMQEARKQVAYANSEFKAVSSSLDDWSKSSDGLNAKLKQLKSNLDSQEAVLREYEKTLEEVKKEYGENSKEALEYATKLNNQQSVVNKIKKEMAGYEDALQEVSEAEKIAAKTGKDVNEVLEDMHKKTEETGDGFTVLKGAVAEFVGNALTKLVDGLKSGISSLVSFADEADKAMNNLTAKTGLYTDGMDDFKDVMENIYNANYGESFEDISNAMAEVMNQSWDWGTDNIEKVTTNALTLRDTFDFEVAESVRAVNMLMEQFGITSDEAFNLIARGTQVGLNKNGDLLDVINEYSVHYSQMGASAEEFFYSLNNGASEGVFSVDKLGDAYKEFGIRAKDTATSTTEAYELLGLDADKMRTKFAEGGESAKQASVEVMDALFSMDNQVKQNQAGVGLFGTMWEDLGKDAIESLMQISDDGSDSFIDLYETMNDINSIKYDSVGEALQGIGRNLQTGILMPIGEKLIPVVSDLATKFQEWLNDPATQEGLKTFTDSVAQFVDNGLVAIKDGVQWFLNNKDAVISGLVAIATGFAAFKVVGIITSVVSAVKSLGSAITVLKVIMAALGGPVTIVITIIASLVAGFITLWKTSDEFRGFWINLWESIKGAVGTAINAIGGFFTDTLPKFFDTLVEWVKSCGEKLSEFVGNIVDQVKFLPEKIWTWLQNTTGKISEWAIEVIEKAKEIGINFIKSVITFFEELPYKIGYILGYAIAKVTQWGIDLHNFVTTEIPKFISSIINYIKELPDKIWTWLVSVITKVTTWKNQMITNAKEIGSSFINKVIEFISQLPNKIWTYLTDIITKVTTWKNNMVTKAKEAGESFINKVVEFVSTLPSKVKEWLDKTISNLSTWVGDMKTKGREAISGLIDKVIEGASSIPSQMAGIGKNIVDGVWSGIKNAKDQFFNNVKGFFSGLVDGAKDALGIHSPSKIFADEVGKWIPAGIAVGIDKNAKTALNSVKNLALDTVGSARAGLNTATTTLGGSSTGGAGGVVNNFTQVINSPKQLSRLDIYRQSKNLLGYAGGGM